MEVLAWLQGKRSYITIAIAALDAVGVQAGWWEAEALRQIIEAALTLIFMRMGMKNVKEPVSTEGK